MAGIDENKLRVGTLVRIRPDLRKSMFSNGKAVYVTKEMSDLAGKVFTIRKLGKDYIYLEGLESFWVSSMLSEIVSQPSEDESDYLTYGEFTEEVKALGLHVDTHSLGFNGGFIKVVTHSKGLGVIMDISTDRLGHMNSLHNPTIGPSSDTVCKLLKLATRLSITPLGKRHPKQVESKFHLRLVGVPALGEDKSRLIYSNVTGNCILGRGTANREDLFIDTFTETLLKELGISEEGLERVPVKEEY